MLDPREFNGAEKQPENSRMALTKQPYPNLSLFMNMESPVLALPRITNQHQHTLLLSYSRGTLGGSARDFFWRFSRLL